MSEDEKLHDLLSRYYHDEGWCPVHIICQKMYSPAADKIALRLEHKDMNYFPKVLEEEDLLDFDKSYGGQYRITTKGMKVMRNEGYVEYAKNRRNDEAEDKKHKASLRVRDYWQSKIAKWQVKLFWFGVLGGFIGFCLSLYNFIDSLIKKGVL